MADHNRSLWRSLAYLILAIIVLAIALKVIGWVFSLAMHLIAILFTLIFVVGFIYVVYLIIRGAVGRT